LKSKKPSPELSAFAQASMCIPFNRQPDELAALLERIDLIQIRELLAKQVVIQGKVESLRGRQFAAGLLAGGQQHFLPPEAAAVGRVFVGQLLRRRPVRRRAIMYHELGSMKRKL
jgi:hypothetical protein